MSDWDPQANEIFLQAAEIASRDERAAYLDAACGPDLALRARVDRLLAAHTAPGNLLDAPVPGMTDVAGATEVRAVEAEAGGQRIGAYTLLQKLGEGGMGSVWAAEQHAPVKRRVALKLIKPGMDSKQVLRRFEAERQALALMDHPNIARVFDAGTTSEGRPFFAMELVKGVPITKYCDELNLSVRERLDLFVPVCRAIQHAHTKGVVHRDVKPSNVLVGVQDGKPVPKVIDFGVAKALHQQLSERTMYTEVGALIGTLEYMAPEQAELSALDVDTRADVYALGVLLYELLTGTTPLDRKRLASAGLAEVVRIIREEEPPRPSTRLSDSAETLPGLAAHRRSEPSRLTKEVRGDLDWIVMKCLEKDRARRYETANGLARDIERHLADEPVEARPPSRGYRLRKLTRRNKGPLAAAALVLLALMGGIAAATWQAVRATKAENLADKRFQNERDARKDADATRKRAETEAAKASAIADLLEEVLSSADPNKAKGAEYTVRQLLDDAAGRLRDRVDAPPEVEAAVRAAIGNAYRRLTLTDQAEPHLRRALAIRRTAPGPREELLAQSLLDYGWNLYESRRYADAEPYAREAVEVYERHGTRNVDTLKALAALHISLDAQRRDDEAEAVANEAIALGRALFPQGHAELASVLHRLASAKRVLGDAAAEPLAVEAVAMHERWHGKNHPETGWGLLVLGDVEFTQRRFPEAEAHYRRCREIFEDSYGGSHAFTKSAQERLESVVETSGDPDALAALRQEKASRLQAALGQGTADTPDGALRLAEIYFGAGLWDETRDQLHAAAAVSEPDAETMLRLAEANRRFADAFKRREGQTADELAARSEEVRWRERLVSYDPTAGHRDELAAAHARHGDAYLRAGLPGDAVEPFEAATGLWTELGREDPENRRYRQERARFGHQLADALVAAGRAGEAVSQADTAVQLYEQLGAEPEAGADYRDLVIRARLTLVRALAAADRDATDAFEALLRLWKPEPKDLNEFAWGLVSDGPVPPQQARLAVRAAERAIAAAPDDGMILNTLGVANYRAEDWQAAEDALAKSNDVLGDRGLAYNAFFLAMACSRLGKPAEARGWYDRGVTWTEANVHADPLLDTWRSEAESVLEIPDDLPEGEIRLRGRAAATWSHDGSHIVATASGLRLINLSNGRETGLTDAGADPAWRPRPEGEIAFTWKGPEDAVEQVWLINPGGEGRRRVGPGGYAGWSADGRVLYFSSRPPGQVLAVDVDDAGLAVTKPRVLFRNCPSYYPAVSPDGTHIAYHDGAALVVIDVATRNEVSRWPVPAWRSALAAWSRDGRYVAFGEYGLDRHFGLWVLDTSSGRAVLAFPGPATKPAWSPDGRRLAFDLRPLQSGEVRIVATAAILERLDRSGALPPLVAERPRAIAVATPGASVKGRATKLPGVVQAEDFDEGGDGIGYHDLNLQDYGAQAKSPRYRTTAVDIDDCADVGGGFNVGGIYRGEWLAYTVEVAEAGEYELLLRMSSPEGGGRLHVEINQTDVTGLIEVPETGNWKNWVTVNAGGVRLSAGQQVMRVVFDMAGDSGHVCNLNWIEVRRSP